MLNDVRVAFGLLTILPVRFEKISARALAYYPLVGLVIGAALTLARWLGSFVLPNLVAVVLLVAVWAILTGALHLDGFADACDGLCATTTRERRLEILRDVHLGAFGAVGLIILLMLKASALASLSGVAPVFLAPVLGRWAIVLAAMFPLARNDGMAVLFRAGLTRPIVFFAAIFAASVCVGLGWFGLVAYALAFGLVAIIARIAVLRLGGLTGDVYGMICESVEAGVLVLGAMPQW